jgi:hypothetical protein
MSRSRAAGEAEAPRVGRAGAVAGGRRANCLEGAAPLEVAGPRRRATALAFSACIAYDSCMQYTLRRVPRSVDAELRRRARRQGKSLNQVAIEALSEATARGGAPVVRRDFSEVVGTWVEDPETERILEEFRRVDPEEWS